MKEYLQSLFIAATATEQNHNLLTPTSLISKTCLLLLLSMTNIYRIISYKRYARIHFYTLHEEVEDDELAPYSLADDFFRRMQDRSALRSELSIFAKVLEAFGNRCVSATRDNLLHHEDSAKALPPYRPLSWLGTADESEDAEPSELLTGDIMLRLYCYPISERIILLFNGDYKTTYKVQDCPQVRPHFWFARRAATAMLAQRREWRTEGDLLLPSDLKLWV